MNDFDNDAPETNAAEAPQKPTPPLPPPPGEEPPAPAPAPAERAPLPDYDPGPTPPKSPGLAAFLAFIFPGAGYLYVWAYERAFMLWRAWKWGERKVEAVRDFVTKDEEENESKSDSSAAEQGVTS